MIAEASSIMVTPRWADDRPLVSMYTVAYLNRAEPQGLGLRSDHDVLQGMPGLVFARLPLLSQTEPAFAAARQHCSSSDQL